MKHTDVNLYIVRQNYTTKEVLRFINGLYDNNRVENLYLVLNDVGSGSGVYGYGKYSYGYGYGYGYNYSSYFIIQIILTRSKNKMKTSYKPPKVIAEIGVIIKVKYN